MREETIHWIVLALGQYAGRPNYAQTGSLAFELGPDRSQKKVSLLEQKEEVEGELLRQIAEILKVPAEAVKNFSEEVAMQIFNNSFESHENSTLNAINNYCSFNPLDKMLELVEENKKLYERLLESEKEKVGAVEEDVGEIGFFKRDIVRPYGTLPDSTAISNSGH